MDHPAQLSRQDPWRTTAIVAAGVAALELLLLVVVGLALIGDAVGTNESGGPKLLAQDEPAASAPAAKQKPVVAQPKLTREETSVMILNGNGENGAASDAADLIRTRSYLIAGTGNAPRSDFPRSLVMYRAGFKAEAARLAKDFHLKRVVPLDGMTPADLQGAHVALIVGG